MPKLYLFDIEGTTTDIAFVHKVLFPYSLERMEKFVLENQTHPAVAAALQKVRDEDHRLGLYEIIGKLQQWIKEDKKHPALKEIQGLIWDVGYQEGHFKGHVYPDVAPAFARITDRGDKVAIYSSGSVHAQKLIFGYSEAGDLTPFISAYFDTKVGGKRERASYERIARETNFRSQDITFFSDIPEELEAAEAAGLKVLHVLRPGTLASRFSTVQNFESV